MSTICQLVIFRVHIRVLGLNMVGDSCGQKSVNMVGVVLTISISL